MLQIKKYLLFLTTLLLTLIGDISFAGWLEVPASLDAKGMLQQYLVSNSPSASTDYTGNIERIGKLFHEGKIYTDIKDDFLNTILANIHADLNSKYNVSYGFGSFQLSDEDKKILDRLGILQAVENFRFIPLDADELKKLGILTDDNAYSYFKNELAPIVMKALDFTKINSKLGEYPKTAYVDGYPILLVPKNYLNLKLMFKYLFTKQDFLDNIVAFEIPYHGKTTLALVGLPNNPPSNMGNTTILSNLALKNEQLQYLIKGKIKYPKELEPCFSGLDASTINDLTSLASYMQGNCKNLLSVDLDCAGTNEFIGNFNQGDPDQYTVVYGLDEKDGLLYVVPVQRFFQKRLVALLPSHIYNSSNNCGYNLLFQDLLSKKIDGIKSNTQGTHRLVWSSRNQGWPTSCSKWTDNSGIFEGVADSNSFADACDVATLPNGFLDKGNDLVINYGVYMTGDTNNMQLYYGLKDSSDNIQNMYEAGKYLGFDTNGQGLETKDLNIGFNNGVYNNGVFTPRYWQVNTHIFVNSDGYKDTIQNVEDKLIYNWQIKGADNSELLDSIVDSSYFKKVFDNDDYGPDNLNRYSKIFIFGSGASSDNKIDLNYLDIGFNDYTTYYIFSLKTLADSTKKLELTQSLNFDGYNIFFKDIGIDDYDNGDDLDGEFVTFSGQNTFFTFDKYLGDTPKVDVSNAIDIDALRVEFGGDNVGKYKKITHLKLVYDKSQDMYVIKQSDKGPLSETFIQGIQLGGILGQLLKDCSLANFVNDDLKDCSHGALQPLNVDNDKEDIGNGFIDWPEWVYSSGSELRIFNNIVKKDNFGYYKIVMQEILYSNNLEYCKKEAQTIDYYKGHNDEDNALEVTENGKTYKGYSPDETQGVSIIFKQGDYKFVYTVKDSGTNFFTKTYELNQVIEDPDNSITCE